MPENEKENLDIPVIPDSILPADPDKYPVERGELSTAGIGGILRVLQKQGPQFNEYFIKFRGRLVKASIRDTAGDFQQVVEATNARAALTTLGNEYDIQELIDITKL